MYQMSTTRAVHVHKKVCFSLNKVLYANVVVVAPMLALTTRASYEVKYKKSQVNVLTSTHQCFLHLLLP